MHNVFINVVIMMMAGFYYSTHSSNWKTKTEGKGKGGERMEVIHDFVISGRGGLMCWW